MTTKEQEIKDEIERVIRKYPHKSQYIEDEIIEVENLLKEVRKEMIEKVEKWDFYELREELRLFAFDDDKDYVSEFRKKVIDKLKEMKEK
jgi:acetyl-CoA carboxylase alpha subunit